ncbi:MAG: SPOR domain-containing protein [Pseudolabrys sp.]|nr:SPOR domain-containing protein [Pseudolabrys sp.]MDP2296814.1 SPOR domain-containing protein [Pseudolabrys sp.]
MDNPVVGGSELYPDLNLAYMVAEVTVNVLDHITAKRAGALGGFFASGVQFLSSTLDDFITAAFSLDPIALKLFGSFAIGSLGYAFFGGLFAYFLQVRTQSRFALFLAGAMATTTGVNGLAPIIKFVKRADVSFISTAYAQDIKSVSACDNILNFTVLDGLSKFLGLSASGYRVVVGSFKEQREALAFANKINAEKPTNGAFVGERAPCNEFYPVVIGDTTPTLSEAKELQAKLQKQEFGKNAYISYRR